MTAVSPVSSSYGPVTVLACALLCGCGGDSDGYEGDDDDAADDDFSWDDICGDDETPAGCEAAATCEGDLWIGNADDHAALVLCESITRSLDISENDWTESIDLPCLCGVGGDLLLRDNATLASVDGLSRLRVVGGDLDIWGNPAITDLDGFANLEYVAADINIRWGESLTSIRLPSFTAAGDDLDIGDNLILTEIDLPVFTSTGGRLDIAHNDSLTTLEGLSALQTVGDYMDVECNRSLTSLEGLASLQSVADSLHIWENTVLTSLTMPSFATVHGTLAIHDNHCLLESEAEAFVDAIEVGGKVTVYNNGSDHPCN